MHQFIFDNLLLIQLKVRKHFEMLLTFLDVNWTVL